MTPAYASYDGGHRQDLLLFPKATPGIPGNTYRDLRYLLEPANPSGFNQSVSFWRGTPNRPMAKTEYTYTVRESKGGSASLTFIVSVKPKATALTATAGSATGEVDLSWNGISGVNGWEYQQDGGTWTAITGSTAATTSHTFTGLTAGTAYSFKVRAFVGTGNTKVAGVASAAATATPS